MNTPLRHCKNDQSATSWFTYLRFPLFCCRWRCCHRRDVAGVDHICGLDRSRDDAELGVKVDGELQGSGGCALACAAEECLIVRQVEQRGPGEIGFDVVG